MNNLSEVKKQINSYVRDGGGIFPSRAEFYEKSNFSPEQTEKFMTALVEDGFLTKKGDWFGFPETDFQDDVIVKTILENPELISTHKTPPSPPLLADKEKRRRGRPLGFSPKNKITPDEKFEEAKTPSPLSNLSSIIGDFLTESPVVDVDETPSSFYEENLIPQEVKSHEFERVKKPSSFNFMGIDFKKNRERKKEVKYNIPIFIVQIMMGLIGVGASIISVYYTTYWLVEFLPLPFALLLSSIMIGFSVFAFEAVILFLSGEVTQKKTTRLLVASGLIFLWIIVSAFSITSTVAGQYNKHISNLKEKNQTDIDTGRLSWNLLQERKKDIVRRIEDYQKQNKMYEVLAGQMNDLKDRVDNERAWQDAQTRTERNNWELNRLTTELGKLREEEQRQLEEARKTGEKIGEGTLGIPDFYGWIANIIHLHRDWVQFLLSLFPAIFVDIISPIGIAIALFLRNKNK